jgi:AmmeMemoRadiSam system protein A
MVGDVDAKKLADALSKYVDEDTLVVASSDLSHYKPYDQCRQTDNATISSILGMDADKMLIDGDACGKIPVLALMQIAKRKGWRNQLLDYKNSGDTAGDKGQGVVGYSSIGFYDGLNTDEQKALLELAQETLVRHYNGEQLLVDESKLPPKLLEDKACFVTLNQGGQLRGCIGHLVPQTKLYKCVIENALNAALNDGRFNPVQKGELSSIKIEISILTVPRPLRYDGPDDLKARLIPGIDGVILQSGQRQSTFLPVVWEMLPDKDEFLSALCRKQGSPSDCWKGAKVQTYQAQEFHQDGF